MEKGEGWKEKEGEKGQMGKRKWRMKKGEGWREEEGKKNKWERGEKNGKGKRGSV